MLQPVSLHAALLVDARLNVKPITWTQPHGIEALLLTCTNSSLLASKVLIGPKSIGRTHVHVMHRRLQQISSFGLQLLCVLHTPSRSVQQQNAK